MPKTDMPRIPIVDLSGDLSIPETRDRAAGAIRTALQEIGFFGIANHGVPDQVVAAAFAESARFFAMPVDRKLETKINAGHRGYMPMTDQHRAEASKPNLSESFLIGVELEPDDPGIVEGWPLHGFNQWPALDGFRAPMEEYHRAMSALGLRMLPLFDAALELPDGFFTACYERPMAFIRALHYPPAPEDLPPDQFGAAPHSDFGFITILAQDDVGGLQVATRGGEWIDAPNLPGVFMVNIGDMLMRWTNDRFRSTLHRVNNAPGRDRYSLPFFFDPQFETEVACLSSCCDASHPPIYPPVVWGDYLTERFDANHAYRKQAS